MLAMMVIDVNLHIEIDRNSDFISITDTSAVH